MSLWLATIAALVVILVTPPIGAWSDRVGRRTVLITLAIASAILPITMFALMASGSPARALFGAVVLAGVAGGVSAVGAVATAEQFAGEARVTGLALGATMATAIFGGLTPWAAQLLVDRTGWTMAPGAMIAIVALCVLPVLVMLRETAPLVAASARPSRSASS
jgi:MHS family proline/betaine transporter-like MFS transporter